MTDPTPQPEITQSQFPSPQPEIDPAGTPQEVPPQPGDNDGGIDEPLTD